MVKQHVENYTLLFSDTLYVLGMVSHLLIFIIIISTTIYDVSYYYYIYYFYVLLLYPTYLWYLTKKPT